MRRLFVAGNWKMNTESESAISLASGVAQAATSANSIDVLVAPPFPYLAAVKSTLDSSPVLLGAQNVYFTEPGAFTGEVSANMLRDVGCDYVILGHSERRHVLHESDAFINQKVRHSLKVGLKVILCVGELLAEREANETEIVLDRQMGAGLAGVNAAKMENIVIAYEPVWAIGTGKTAKPEQAEAAHLHLRTWLANAYSSEVAEATRIQYGGSVKPDNAYDLLSQPNVDGALVGGASLKADLFSGIIQAAVKLGS